MGRVWNFKQRGQGGISEKLTSEQIQKMMRKKDISLLKGRAGQEEGALRAEAKTGCVLGVFKEKEGERSGKRKKTTVEKEG